MRELENGSNYNPYGLDNRRDAPFLRYALIALTIAIAAGFSIYSHVHWYVSLQNGVVIAGILGSASAFLGVSGIPFMVYWGVRHFRPQGVGFFALWACACAIVSYSAYYEEQSQENWLPRDQALFLQGVIPSCISAQANNPLNKGARVSEDRISRYCKCYGRKVTDMISSTELVAIQETNRPPASLEKKIAAIAPECTGQSQ